VSKLDELDVYVRNHLTTKIDDLVEKSTKNSVDMKWIKLLMTLIAAAALARVIT
jgi:hypothetical protein